MTGHTYFGKLEKWNLMTKNWILLSVRPVYQKLWIAVSFIHSQAFVIYQKKKKRQKGVQFEALYL